MAASTLFSALLPEASGADRKTIEAILGELPYGMLAEIASADGRIRPLRSGERYADASPELARLAINVDLAVSTRRTFRLHRAHGVRPFAQPHDDRPRTLSRARLRVRRRGVPLGNVGEDSQMLHRRDVVRHAVRTGIDEYFAETCRSWLGHGAHDYNDASSHWPKANRARLLQVDHAIYDFLSALFQRLDRKHGAGRQLDLGLIA